MDVPDLLEGLGLDLERRVRDLELVAQQLLQAAQQIVRRMLARPQHDVPGQGVTFDAYTQIFSTAGFGSSLLLSLELAAATMTPRPARY